MPAAPIESYVKTWIGANTAAGTRVSAGSRLQASQLPAVVIEVMSGQIASLTGSTQTYDEWSVSIRAVAATELDAVNLLEASIGAIQTNIPAGSVIYEPAHRTIQSPVVGEGDEAEPSIAQQTVAILHLRT